MFKADNGLVWGGEAGAGGYLILVGQLEKKQASRMQLTG